MKLGKGDFFQGNTNIGGLPLNVLDGKKVNVSLVLTSTTRSFILHLSGHFFFFFT